VPRDDDLISVPLERSIFLSLPYSVPDRYLSTTAVTYHYGGMAGDKPLSLVRVATQPWRHVSVAASYGTVVVFPHADWRGEYFAATALTGARCCTDGYFPGEGATNWEAQQVGLVEARSKPWWGSIVSGTPDQGNLIYRRNRYFNPASGQFTQIDPIGLAGGPSAYGYAGGGSDQSQRSVGAIPARNDC
jgi:hypothetical protein